MEVCALAGHPDANTVKILENPRRNILIKILVNRRPI